MAKAKSKRKKKLHFDNIIPLPIRGNPGYSLSEMIIANQKFEIITPNTGQITEGDISSDMLSKLGGAKGLFHFGFGFPQPPDFFKSTWPTQWKYLTAEHLKKLDELGIPVLNQDCILPQGLQINLFFQGFYHTQNIALFLDSWIEIIWQDYVVEHEIRRFQHLNATRQINVTIELPGAINFQNAETWIALENCTIRIRSMWERLQKFIIPIYFIHETAPITTDKKYWKNLKDKAQQLMNDKQLPLYNLLEQSIRDTEKSPLKELRDNLIHQISPRPASVLPTSNIHNASLPSTVSELQQLVFEERSRVREALIIMAGIILAKTPLNKEIL